MPVVELRRAADADFASGEVDLTDEEVPLPVVLEPPKWIPGMVLLPRRSELTQQDFQFGFRFLEGDVGQAALPSPGELDSDHSEGFGDAVAQGAVFPPGLKRLLRSEQIGQQLAVRTRPHGDPPG